MTNREILDKVIEKAETYGFENNKITCFDTCDIPPRLYVRFLFCEDFAKAFWGEIKYCKCSGFCIQYQGCGCGSNESGWKYHLQQMAIEKEPLKYLEKFL